MKLGMDRGSLVAWDQTTTQWVFGEPWGHDLLAFLGAGTDAVRAAEAAFAEQGRITGEAPSGTAAAGVTVVTGCDSRIGKALGWEFHQRGLTRYATGMKTEAMQDLAAAGSRVAALDVTDAASIDPFINRLAGDGVMMVDVLVNHAGFGAMGP
jgi:hypothetical protein